MASITSNLVSRTGEPISRRKALGYLGGLAIGLVGCTPARMVLRLYPSSFDTDVEQVEEVLRAFAITVIPGAPDDYPHLIQIFYEDYIGLTSYRGYFASDLCQRAKKCFGASSFQRLPLASRTQIIQNGLKDGGVTAKLYTACVFLTQVAFFSGAFGGGCTLIDIEEQRFPPSIEQLTYANPDDYLARAMTADGNPA